VHSTLRGGAFHPDAQEVAMAPAVDVSGHDQLRTEATLLRSRVLAIRRVVRHLPGLSDADVVDAITRIRPLINHLAAHGRAEEHIIYPYAERFGGTGLTLLRDDHTRLEELASAITAWTLVPTMERARLALSLTAFCDLAEAHLDREADRCLEVIHAHSSAMTERYLHGEVEIETFETEGQ
jgi:hemerythrin-like domain-containing protein